MLTHLRSLYLHNFDKLSFSTNKLQYISVNLALFAIPFFISQPQLLTGTIVNFGLVYFALNFKKAELLPAIFLPSLAAFLHGVVWGPLTPYLAVLMPLIWLGNAALVFTIRHLAIQKTNKILTIIVAAAIKALLLFAGTFIIVNALNFPQALITSMGLLQLATALAGGLIYLVLFRNNNNGGQKSSATK